MCIKICVDRAELYTGLRTDNIKNNSSILLVAIWIANC